MMFLQHININVLLMMMFLEPLLAAKTPVLLSYHVHALLHPRSAAKVSNGAYPQSRVASRTNSRSTSCTNRSRRGNFAPPQLLLPEETTATKVRQLTDGELLKLKK